MKDSTGGEPTPRARQELMIGYSHGLQGSKLWEVLRNKVVVSRDVCFDELGTDCENKNKTHESQDQYVPDMALQQASHMNSNSPGDIKTNKSVNTEVEALPIKDDDLSDLDNVTNIIYDDGLQLQQSTRVKQKFIAWCIRSILLSDACLPGRPTYQNTISCEESK